ncbi:putative protein AUXIN SIGNALING F-BOX 2 [Cocos nucifera]|uniref:F-box domain-containing protein n=1 Tax=Cocos nucifera TaxID=13894 RepID=A0A8K0N081_COCNU|nr:putative protein AUXIN SIGNALING F-BOX 2 [Cocos nucifera]
MRGSDLINSRLPDELIMDVFQRLEDKSDCDAVSLVCRRWRKLERATRRTIKIGASGPANQLLENVVDRFKGLQKLFVDERLPVASLSLPRAPPSRVLPLILCLFT